MNGYFRIFVISCLIGFVTFSAGCSKEPRQREDFISFLQREVIPQNGGILLPTKTMRNKFGEYAQHYDIIVTHNKAIEEKIKKPLEKFHREYSEAMKPESNVKERREATIKYRDALPPILQAIDEEFKRTEEEISKLNQPEGLREPYDKVVDKYVRKPAETLKFMIPAIIEMLEKNLELLDFIASSKGKIEIKDRMIQVQDQSLLPKLKKLQDEVATMQQGVQSQYNDFVRQPGNK